MWCEVPGQLIGLDVLEKYGCRMVAGLGLTAQLVFWSVLFGLFIGLGLALMRFSGPLWARRLAGGFITFFRGTPLLCQLYLVYYGFGSIRPFWQDIGLWWLFRDPFYCCLLTFTLNTAAYQGEILRGALIAVPRGQWEAAQAMGLGRVPTFWRVILPQAMIIALRPLGNELIVMIKASAIASLVTLFDLMGVTKLAFARSFDLSIYLVAALIYLSFVEVIRRLWDYFERRLTRHLAFGRM